MSGLSQRWISLLERQGLRRASATRQDWSAEDGRAFRAQAWTRALGRLRCLYVGAAVGFLAFWPWDLHLDPAAAQYTLAVRIAAAVLLLAIAALPAFSRMATYFMPAMHALGSVVAVTALMLIGLLLPGGYDLVHPVIMLLVVAIAAIGPYDTFVAPLALTAAALPNALVLWIAAARVSLPGLPSYDSLLGIALLHAGAAALAVLLGRFATVERQQLFLAERDADRLNTTDPLTGAKNRRALQERFAHEVSRQRRARGSTTFLMLDIDHLKRINEAYGRAVGDQILRDLVRRWALVLRDLDILCRVGGEEFVALLPDTVGLDALMIAERLRHETAELPVMTSAGPIPVTVSLGVVVAGPDIDDLDRVLASADAALFEAKAAGRDRIMVSSPRALAA